MCRWGGCSEERVQPSLNTMPAQTLIAMHGPSAHARAQSPRVLCQKLRSGSDLLHAHLHSARGARLREQPIIKPEEQRQARRGGAGVRVGAWARQQGEGRAPAPPACDPLTVLSLSSSSRPISGSSAPLETAVAAQPAAAGAVGVALVSNVATHNRDHPQQHCTGGGQGRTGVERWVGRGANEQAGMC